MPALHTLVVRRPHPCDTLLLRHGRYASLSAWCPTVTGAHPRQCAVWAQFCGQPHPCLCNVPLQQCVTSPRSVCGAPKHDNMVGPRSGVAVVCQRRAPHPLDACIQRLTRVQGRKGTDKNLLFFPFLSAIDDRIEKLGKIIEKGDPKEWYLLELFFPTESPLLVGEKGLSFSIWWRCSWSINCRLPSMYVTWC